MDFDSERENVLLIAKSAEFEIPTTREGEIELVKNDITILIEALNALLSVSVENDFFSREQIIDDYIKKITDNYSLTLVDNGQ